MSKKNLANAILAAPVSDTATSATLVTGYGTTMPTVPFKMTFTKFGQLSTMGNSEIVLVTARSGEVLTIERAKGGTTAKAFEAGDIVSNGIYIENSVAVGDIFMSLRATPSVGRLFMDGGTYNKSDYPLMYKLVQDNAAYGTTGGSSGSETFTLADMRERMPFGKSSNSPFTTLGAIGGSGTHYHNVPLQSGYDTSKGYPYNGSVFEALAGEVGASIYSKSIVSRSRLPLSGSLVTANIETWRMRLADTDHMNPYMVVNYEVVAG